MLLGQVAVTVWQQHGVIATVVAIFQQRLFHPVCSLDGNIVIELGKMAAKTGVRYLYGQKVFSVMTIALTLCIQSECKF